LVAGWTIPTAVASGTTGSNYTYGAADQGAQTTGSSLSGYHASSGTPWSSFTGNGSTYSLSSNTWAVGDYYQVTLDTRGYGEISISWDQTRSSTGPSVFDLKMSVDGGANFTTVNAGYFILAAGASGSGTGAWSTTTNQSAFTTTTIAGSSAADKASVIFRFVNTSTVSSAGGTSRIDNILVTGNAVPAPGAIALLGVAGLVGSRRRR
jgi:MYXO-CTERM domain-containing protein